MGSEIDIDSIYNFFLTVTTTKKISPKTMMNRIEVKAVKKLNEIVWVLVSDTIF